MRDLLLGLCLCGALSASNEHISFRALLIYCVRPEVAFSWGREGRQLWAKIRNKVNKSVNSILHFCPKLPALSAPAESHLRPQTAHSMTPATGYSDKKTTSITSSHDNKIDDNYHKTQKTEVNCEF